MKKFFAILVCLLSAATAWANGVEIDGIHYILAGDSATVTYMGSPDSVRNTYSGAIVIPPLVHYNGSPFRVTTIGSAAFYGCSALISISIPYSIGSIGYGTFQSCTSLQSVEWNAKHSKLVYDSYYGGFSAPFPNSVKSFTFGDSVQYIPASLCEGLDSITFVIIPQGIDSIGPLAFLACRSLQTINIPDNVSVIGDDAFASCTGLTSVTIGQGLDSIGYGAFEGCTSLQSVDWNAKHSKLDYYSYYRGSSAPFPSSVKSFTFGDSVQYIPAYLCYELDSITSVLIPQGVDSIGPNAFSACRSLQSINIPDNVSIIGEYAFTSCTGLTSVTIGQGVDSIGYGAFEGCTSLQSVEWNAKHSEFDCEYYGYYSNYDTYYNFSVPFPNSVKSFTFGDSVQYIPAYLCYELDSITSVLIPQGVDSIGPNAFAYCKGLQSVEWYAKHGKPARNRYVDVGVGSYYIGPFPNSIKSFTFGDSVQNIPAYLCYGLNSLNSITSNPLVAPTVDSTSFLWVRDSIPVHVPCGSLSSYQATWPSRFNYVESLPYMVSAATNDTILGIVKVSVDCSNNSVILHAVPNTGSYFLQWSDGNTDSLRTIIVTQDISLTAYFASDSVIITNPVGSLTLVPYVNSVTVNWPVYDDDSLYVLTIHKDTALVCTARVNRQGQVLQLSYAAPARGGHNWVMRPWDLPASGLSYSIPGLESCTEYTCTLQTIKVNGTSELFNGRFTTNVSNDSDRVDMGLSVQWASRNVGATIPVDYGDYIAWGEVAQKDTCSWYNYRWSNGEGTSLAKYNPNSGYGIVDSMSVLAPTDDAAFVNWGDNWRMPTSAEWSELRNNCDWRWMTPNGVNGYKVTAANGNYIFIPAAGYRSNADQIEASTNGDYWSSSLRVDDPHYAWTLHFDSSYIAWSSSNHRNCGLSIRPIWHETTSSLIQIDSSNRNTKFLHNGMLFIRHNGEVFNASGQLVRW